MLNRHCLLNIFKASPMPALVVLPDDPGFTIVDLNDAYLQITGLPEAHLLQKKIFTAFPGNREPNHISALQKSLHTVIQSGRPDKMPVQKYDIPQRSTGELYEKYWQVENIPILTETGTLEFILHTLTSITGYTLKEQKIQTLQPGFLPACEHKNATSEMLYEKTRYPDKKSAKGKELEIVNRLLTNAQRIVHMGNWEYNTATNQLFCSDEVYRVFGIEKQRANQFSFEDFKKYIHPEDLPLLMNAKAGTESGRVPLDVEHRVISQNGQEKIVHELGELEYSEETGSYWLQVTITDITERKKVEKLLQEREALLHSVLNTSLSGIMSFTAIRNAQNRIVDFEWQLVNDTAAKMINRVKEDLAGKRLLDEIPYERVNGLFNFYVEVVETGVLLNREHYYAHENIKAWFRVIALKLKDGCVVTFTDITEQKKEEQRLKLLESVITNTNDAVLISEAAPIGQHGPVVIYANEAFTRMTGYTAAEIIGRTPRILQGSKTDRKELDRLRKALESWKSCEITTINYKKNGEEFWVNISISPVADEKGWFTHWIGIQRDVTERKQYEQKMLEYSRKMTHTLESIQDGFYALDKNWTVSYWNKEAENLLHTKREHILGKNLWEVFKESVQLKFYQEYHRALKENIPVRFEEFFPPLKTWYEMSAYPSDEGLTVYFKNITERKDAETKLKELNRLLLKQTKELAFSNKELEQFAYVASHDLQEPLRMITSFLSQLEKKYGNVIDDKGRQYIGFATDGAKRMRQIILDLLDYSRIGRMDYKFAEVDLNELVKEILILYRKQIQEKKALIKVNKLPVIKTAHSPMMQVFQNLISNSLKYTAAGVIPEISVSADSTSSHWQFSVSDNGIGIDPQYFEKIFIIFQRLHSKDTYSGSGIGLAITKKIVEGMGGRIWVTSKEEEGSTFYFTIPKYLKTDA